MTLRIDHSSRPSNTEDCIIGRTGTVRLGELEQAFSPFRRGGQTLREQPLGAKKITTIGSVTIPDPAMTTVVGISMFPASWESPSETVHRSRFTRS
jgi:hypothetical protein